MSGAAFGSIRSTVYHCLLVTFCQVARYYPHFPRVFKSLKEHAAEQVPLGRLSFGSQCVKHAHRIKGTRCRDHEIRWVGVPSATPDYYTVG